MRESKFNVQKSVFGGYIQCLRLHLTSTFLYTFLLNPSPSGGSAGFEKAQAEAEEILKTKMSHCAVVFDKDQKDPAKVDAKVKELVDALIKAHMEKKNTPAEKPAEEKQAEEKPAEESS